MPYKNPEDRKKAQLRWHYKNKEDRQESIAAARKKGRDKIRKFVWDYKCENPCVDCGEDDPIVLEFDHVTGEKHFNVSEVASRYYSLKRVEAEISKCEVCCANCHRRRTHTRQSQVDATYRNYV